MLCMGSYYAQVCDEDALICIQADGVELIATGWLIIVIVALVYMIFMILKCLSCNACECLVNSKLFRIAFAIGLLVGGVLTAIGYWYYSAEFGGLDDDVTGRFVAYYIGLSVLVIGL